MSEQLDRFIDLMKGIFEIDKSDLDFGIYRIMNIRKREIETFLTEGLPKRVQETLAPFADNSDAIREEMAALKKKCDDLGMAIENVPKLYAQYTALQKKLAQGTDLSALETDVYSALFSFFNRYYDEGDFISKRRYKEGVYAIPYEGEEVKLYWANQDQYYIKTSENFKDYTFKADDYTVHFRLVDATTEQNNNKEAKDAKRVFMLFQGSEEYPDLKTFEYDSESKELIIRFVYDIPVDKKNQKAYDELNYNAITEYLIREHKEKIAILLAVVSSDKKKQTTLIQKHLNAYVAKNTFDYFIHKDLGGFLRRELDFYIKNEIMHLDDLDTDNERSVETYLAKIKAVKRVGNIIIDFLAQIENFQKKLWLKKKFVVETNWCMTLDKVDEKFYPEIIANPEQIQEWIDMYAVDEIKGDLTHCAFTNPPSSAFLRENQNLLIDTKHFSEDFKGRLVESIDDLDEQTNGLMINGDNFHALTFLNCHYSNNVDCIYIDPPFNTDASKILYKNNYEHSSWLALMNDRILEGRKLLQNTSIQCTAIDEYELKELYALLQEIFGRDQNAGVIAIRINPSGRPRDGGFALSHEYALVFRNSEDAKISKVERTEEQAKRYDKTDKYGAYEQRNFRREGSNSNREDGIRQWYPIYVNNEDLQIRVPEMKWNEITNLWDILEEAYPNESVIYPITDDGIEKNWRWAWENVKKDYSQFYAIRQKSGIQVYYKFRPNESGVSPVTFWDDKRYSATEYGTKLLKDILPNCSFSYPKSIYNVEDMLGVIGLAKPNATVLDYFAGSATTGHATINLNKKDNGSRKYILVEMGEYFDSVTKPRMQRIIYSADWKKGKPQNRDTGIPQIIKYMRLESYEDALSNIEFNSEESGLLSLFGDDYLIRYMLDLETEGSLLNVAAFSNPFDYKMKITEKNESRLRKVDLCETFNYLIGLSVTRQSSVTYYSAASDENGAYDGAVKLIPDNSGKYAFMQIEGTLPNGERALVIWRTIDGDVRKSNAALDAYFLKHRINPQDREYDVIFVNGDNNLENLRTDKEIWKVVMTETEFKRRMFEETE